MNITNNNECNDIAYAFYKLGLARSYLAEDKKTDPSSGTIAGTRFMAKRDFETAAKWYQAAYAHTIGHKKGERYAKLQRDCETLAAEQNDKYNAIVGLKE